MTSHNFQHQKGKPWSPGALRLPAQEPATQPETGEQVLQSCLFLGLLPELPPAGLGSEEKSRTAKSWKEPVDLGGPGRGGRGGSTGGNAAADPGGSGMQTGSLP